MNELSEEIKKEGFYIVSTIFLENREFIKCGNINNTYIYFFEIVNNKIEIIKDDIIMEKLKDRFCYKSSNKIY